MTANDIWTLMFMPTCHLNPLQKARNLAFILFEMKVCSPLQIKVCEVQQLTHSSESFFMVSQGALLVTNETQHHLFDRSITESIKGLIIQPIKLITGLSWRVPRLFVHRLSCTINWTIFTRSFVISNIYIHDVNVIWLRGSHGALGSWPGRLYHKLQARQHHTEMHILHYSTYRCLSTCDRIEVIVSGKYQKSNMNVIW